MTALRDSIQRLERPRPLIAGSPGRERPGWTLGGTEIDSLLRGGLSINALHEVKPRSANASDSASAAQWMTALGFAVRLAVRRVMTMQGEKPWLLWCWPRALTAELGLPSAVGLAQLGLDPTRLLVVEAPRAADALNALEEGLRSSRMALVFGVLDEVALTPARRLSLASATGATPCLLITHPSGEPAAATATRWRVARAPSAPHVFDRRAPGDVRFRIGLERCRAQPESANLSSIFVEWQDATRRFCLASGVADYAVRPRRAGMGVLAQAAGAR